MQLTATSMDSVVIVVAKCTATRGSVLQDAGTSLICDLLKPPIAQIAIEILVLAVFQIGLRSIDFRINVSVRHEDVEPAIIIHVEEANTPSQQARIHSQAAWVSPILRMQHLPDWYKENPCRLRSLSLQHPDFRLGYSRRWKRPYLPEAWRPQRALPPTR